MPYAAGHRAEVKRKIIDSARRLFNRHGFDNVSLGQIMAGAGLTHGGFYSYFESKSDLYAEVLGCFFTDPNWKNCWEGVHIDMASADVGPQIVRAYLSRQHFENIENSCPMVALPTDVARSDKRAKRAFETVFKGMVSVLERGAQTNSRISTRSSNPAAARARHSTAQAIAALCVGGMVVARASLDRARADNLRDACMTVALNLGGWNKNSKSKSEKSNRNATTHANGANGHRPARQFSNAAASQ
jgi:TetR/AcrR family transcriptional repressor of nem operon